MGSLRGLPQKIGQLLSLRDVDPDEEGKTGVFSPLTEEGQAAPVAEFCGWVRDRLGQEKYNQFNSFEGRGFAASIGQVHRAELKTGEQVAVKAQYPGIAEALAVDLSALGLLLAPLSVAAKGKSGHDLDMKEYRATLGAGIAAELDYESERRALERAVSRTAEIDGIVVPKPISALCSPSVLTMSWIDGQRLEEILHIDGARRERVGQILLRWFLRSWLVWGELHADPHAGNYRFQVEASEMQVGILDFGCRYHLSPEELFALRELCSRIGNIQPKEAFAFFKAMGFKAALLTSFQAKLPDILELLLLPFSSAGKFDVREWKLSEQLEAILGSDRWNFRMAGPASLTFFIRSFSGLLHQLGALGVSLDWSAELEKLGLSAASNRSVVPAESMGGAADLSLAAREMSSETQLQILVEERGEQKARVTLPGTSVERLEELIPDDVLAKLREQGIDPGKLGLSAFEGGCKPQQLFGLTEGDKKIRVWLEKCNVL
jgi:predicted unusual protein kinase regulating ubiquinone biosynthesis (AarF/ABC1/UbiB family)